MVVLNCYGIIPQISISEKLKLYVSNLPKEEHNNWQNEIKEQLVLTEQVSRLYSKKLA